MVSVVRAQCTMGSNVSFISSSRICIQTSKCEIAIFTYIQYLTCALSTLKVWRSFFFQKEQSFRRKKGFRIHRNSSMIFPFGPLYNIMSEREADGGLDKHQKRKSD